MNDKTKIGKPNNKHLFVLKNDIFNLGQCIHKEEDKIISLMHYVNNTVSGLIGNIYLQSLHKKKKNTINEKLKQRIIKKIKILRKIRLLFRKDLKKLKKGVKKNLKSVDLIEKLHSRHEQENYDCYVNLEDVYKQINSDKNN